MKAPSGPWDEWVPGVLSKKQVKVLIDAGLLRGTVIPAKRIGGSSLDLTLSSEVYELPQGSIKPSGAGYQRELDRFGDRRDMIGNSTRVLDPQKTYVVKLRECLALPKRSRIFGQATAKSSIGRIDVLARLIVDGMDCYEFFDPSCIRDPADLFLEITPLTFRVRIKAGISLSQLRLFYGTPDECELSGREANRTFIKESNNDDSSTLSVDLRPTVISGKKVVAFRASKTPDQEPIPLYGKKGLTPGNYWELVTGASARRLSLKKDSFYILRSRERLALPKGVAVYCRANDESFGEMRIHYAGFAHPWFGRVRSDQTGTPLIFEVRGHDVDVSLKNGESMARLIFYRMSEDAHRRDADKEYQIQNLKLSKFFSEWSDVAVASSGRKKGK